VKETGAARVEEQGEIECFRCGICCRRYQPKVSPEEIEAMAFYLSLPPDRFRERYIMVTRIGYLLSRVRDGCIFLDKDENQPAACRIYPARPASCRDWTASLEKKECREGLKGKAEREGPV